jgi:sodium/hydrogen exchanger 10/11
LHFAVGDIIYAKGDSPNGIFVIVTGVVKISYEPSYELLKARDEKGAIPNMEIYSEPTFEEAMTDYYTTGGVLGEMGVVTEDIRAASVTCETGVVAYHLSQSTMRKAVEAFDDRYDSLEGRIWRSCGMKLAAVILPTQPAFQSWTMDKLKTHLELSAVPIGDQYQNMLLPDFITDCILIYGEVVSGNEEEEETYTAPAILPRSMGRIKPVRIKPLMQISAPSLPEIR